ncbi:MAG TPA: AI-2E family transporter [Caulobacteraceae bacterium]|jgi:predicted PurR-regulated permease PerM|nr:AI-2E family transporter [Caulobacteraceae bacterium]
MVADRSTAITRNALVIVAVILGGAALRWLGDIITPLLLAVFLAVMIDGMARMILRRMPGLPRGVATATAILLATLVFVACVLAIANQAGGFAQTLASSTPKLDRLIRETAQTLHIRSPGTVNELLVKFNPAQYLGTIAVSLQGFVSGAIFVLVYVGFIIASRHTAERKVVRLFRSRDERHEALRVFLRVRDSIEAYLWIQTITGAIIAAASWVVMMTVGLSNPVFWAFLIFIVNYVPIFGAAAAIVLPALFAVVQFDSWLQGGIILGALFLITFVVGNIVLPRMQGDSLNMDPLVVLLSLAFWGALWGLAGMFLSTPLTVLVMIILAQFDGSRWIAILLSRNGAPESLLEVAHELERSA